MKDEDLEKHLNPSLYEILGVNRNATPSMIKKGHRDKMLSVHPDRNPNDPTAGQKTVQVSFAYEVLSHPEDGLRYERIYDKYKAAQAARSPKKEEESIKKQNIREQSITKDTWKKDLENHFFEALRKMPEKLSKP